MEAEDSDQPDQEARAKLAQLRGQLGALEAAKSRAAQPSTAPVDPLVLAHCVDRYELSEQGAALGHASNLCAQHSSSALSLHDMRAALAVMPTITIMLSA